MASRKDLKRIDLPVNTLRVGLRNQEINKVSSFCKEADNVFVSFCKRVESITSISSTPASPSLQLPAKNVHAKSVVQSIQYSDVTIGMYKDGLHMLLTSSKDNLHKNQHIIFIQQTLQITQDHLSRAVKQVMTNLQKVQVGNLSNKFIEKQSDMLLTLITDMMLEVRELNTQVKRIIHIHQQRQQHLEQKQTSIQNSGRERRDSGSSVLSFLEGAIGGSSSGEKLSSTAEGVYSESQRQLVLTWDSLDERAVIVEGLLAGEIQFLQKYLTQRFGSSTAEWMHVIKTGLNETLIFLQEKEMTYASKMLQNMGFDVRTKLRQICLYTSDKVLRDYLFQELQSLNSLTAEEIDMVKFIHRLEELYSCPSFKVAKLLRMEDSVGDLFTDPLHLGEYLPAVRYNFIEDGMCGDMADTDIQNSETAYYSHNILEWVRSWDLETRHRIIVDQALYRKDIKSDVISHIPAVTIWNYLCTRQDIIRLREWIDTQYPLKNKEVLVEPVWPYNMNISKEMVDTMKGTTTCTHYELVNEFARVSQIKHTPPPKWCILAVVSRRRGIFTTKDQESFESLVSRLRKVQGVLIRPHIIEKSDDPLLIGMQDFHRHMLQYCIDNHMPELLYFYLDYWNLCATTTSLDHFHLEDCAPPWVDMLLSFRIASMAHFDPDTVFQANLSTSKCIQNVMNVSVAGLIEEGLIATSLATLMYSSDRLKQFLVNPPEIAKQVLMNVRTLYLALFDNDVLNNNATISTVYQLLEGNISFDLNRLFGWQEKNLTIAEDTLRDLPHFSHEELVRSYGHKENLQFTYFIKQGRPCFAFANFVLEELKFSSGTTGILSPKRIERACLRIHRLGLCNFHKPQITAACALFMEMLSQDCTVFRVHVQTANELLTHKCAGFVGTLDEKRQFEKVARQHISSCLQYCLRQKEKYIKDVLCRLEEAICWYIGKHHTKRSSAAAEQKWLLALAFCKCHNLWYSTQFLQACAAEDDWLRFLTHAQTFQYPPLQVTNVVPCFKNPMIREHMRFVMNNMVKKYAGQKDLPKVNQNRIKRDFRARLYAKVGVSKKEDTQNYVSSTDEEEMELSSLEFQKSEEINEENKDIFKLDVVTDNLFDLLLSCQKTPYPAKFLCNYATENRNSILAVLASCFKDGNQLECLCTWISVSLAFDSTNNEKKKHGITIHGSVIPTTTTDDIRNAASIKNHQHNSHPSISISTSASDTQQVTSESHLGNDEDPKSRSRTVKKDQNSVSEASGEFTRYGGCKLTTWSLSDLYKLVHQALNTSEMTVLYDGFFIFFPNTVLLPFLHCLAKFNQQEDMEGLKVDMETFIHDLKQLKEVKKETLDCHLFPVQWLEELVMSVINSVLCRLTSSCVGKFLKLLDETQVTQTLTLVKNVPDISLLHKIHLQIKEANIHINYSFLLNKYMSDSSFALSPPLQNLPYEQLTTSVDDFDDSESPYSYECKRLTSELQEKGHWNEARVVAELVGLSSIDITLNQLNTDITSLQKSGVWTYSEVQTEFWKKSEQLLTRYDVDPITAAKFFQEHADKSTTSSSKEHLYQLAYNWWCKASTETTHSIELFTHIWRAKIKRVMERKSQGCEITTKKPHFQHAFDKSQLRKLEPVVSAANTEEIALSGEETSTLQLLLNELLDNGQLLEVTKVATHFRHPCQDLKIISTCHRLAIGELSPATLDVETKKLLTSPGGSSARVRRTSLQMITLPRLGSRLSIASQMSELGDIFMEEDNVLTCIQLLEQLCTHGKQCCEFIFVIYQIAKMLDIEYKEALAVDEFKLLCHVLKSELHSKYLLAKSFIQAAHIPDSQVAGFLCNLVVESLQLQLGILPTTEKNSPTRVAGAIVSPIRPTSVLPISEIVQLCDDPAILGQHLLNYVVATNSSEVESTAGTLSLNVELLIYAHDCFTVACHMEGISNLLRTCRTVTQMLDVAEEYTLMWIHSVMMQIIVKGKFWCKNNFRLNHDLDKYKHFCPILTVRLLTLVGRYSEMVYIFDILKHQHQFELLFRKGTDKESKLKLAILDYLQRYHPDDTDTYTMVALHFTMYREIAQMLEKAASRVLKSLSGKTLDNNADNQGKLQKVLHYLSDAAESYVKESCLRHADQCVKKAKLVALQLQFLPLKIRVVNLDTEGLRHFVRGHKRVHEVKLVVEAYNQNDVWNDAIYLHVIKQGDFKYLSDVMAYVNIPSIVNDIAERFALESHNSKQSLLNMKRFLLKHSDPKTALRLVNKLDIKDTANELMKGPAGAYLKDCTINKTI